MPPRIHVRNALLLTTSSPSVPFPLSATSSLPLRDLNIASKGPQEYLTNPSKITLKGIACVHYQPSLAYRCTVMANIQEVAKALALLTRVDYRRLAALRSKSDSYNDIIEQLLDEREEKSGGE